MTPTLPQRRPRPTVRELAHEIGTVVVLNEFGDFPMMRRMLLGIRDRAERTQVGGTR